MLCTCGRLSSSPRQASQAYFHHFSFAQDCDETFSALTEIKQGVLYLSLTHSLSRAKLNNSAAHFKSMEWHGEALLPLYSRVFLDLSYVA